MRKQQMIVKPRPLNCAKTNCAPQRRSAYGQCPPNPRKALAILAVFGVWLTPATAVAYIGPGAGLSALGSLLALLGAVLLLIVGFVWYPVKRMMRKWKAARAAEDDTEAGSPATE